MVLTLTGVVGFFLAVSPILDPYILFEIGSGFTLKINDLLMLFIGLFCFSKYYGVKHKTDYLCILLTGLLVISVMASINSGTNFANSMKNLFVWFVYAIVLTFIWRTPCRDKFLYWVDVFATIAAVFVLVQFVAANLNLPMWDGRLPFFELGKYDVWSGYIDKNTGDIRPNGIFQEASYVGIYLSIAYAQAFKESKLKKAILYALAMLSTTSMVAVISCIIITVYTLIARKNMRISAKTSRKIIFIVLVVIVGLFILVSINDSVSESFAYILKRFNAVDSDLSGARMSSTKYRILGHIDLFARYTPMQKLVGVGVGQYASYFNVSSYSNVWVTTILNSGILGLNLLIGVLALMVRKISPQNKIFFLILLLVLSSDYQWFSWYFFYLISACILRSSEEKFYNKEEG